MKTLSVLNKGLTLSLCLVLISCGNFSFEGAGIGLEVDKEGTVSTNGYIDFNTGLNFDLAFITVPVYDPETNEEIASFSLSNNGMDFNLDISNFLNRKIGHGELPNGRPLPGKSHLKGAGVVEVSDNENTLYYVAGAKTAMVGVAIDEKNLGSYAKYISNEKNSYKQVDIDGHKVTLGTYNENGKKGVLFLVDISSVISPEEMIEVGSESDQEVELDW